MSQDKPVDSASPSPKPASNSGLIIVIVIVLALLCLPVLVGGVVVVAGGVFVFWASDSEPARMNERMDSMSAPAIQADMRETSPAPKFSIPVEPEPVPQP